MDWFFGIKKTIADQSLQEAWLPLKLKMNVWIFKKDNIFTMIRTERIYGFDKSTEGYKILRLK